MNKSYTVASYLKIRLEQLGLERMFGVAGNYTAAFLDTILADHNMNMIHQMYRELRDLDANFRAASETFLGLLKDISTGKIKPGQIMVTDGDYEILDADIVTPVPHKEAENGKQAVSATTS